MMEFLLIGVSLGLNVIIGFVTWLNFNMHKINYQIWKEHLEKDHE